MDALTMDTFTLEFLWYIVFIASIFAYAALDGFDIGVGCLHLFAKTDQERRIFLNAIGPVWDGNSLWVIITAGGLLAGFPKAFACLLSTLYVPTFFLVFGFIMRSVAIEVRSKSERGSWRKAWDTVFAFASFCLAFGFGVVLANLIKGLPLTKEGTLYGGVSALFAPYALACGVFTTLLFMLHGALFLNMKTEGKLQMRVRALAQNIHLIFLFAWGILTVVTLIYELEMTDIFRRSPWLLATVGIALCGICSIPKLLEKNYNGWAFLSSFLIIGSFVLLYALGTFPAVVKIMGPEESLTIYNAASSPLTLKILLIIAALGVPLFLIYLACAYKVFRGKVALEAMSY